MSSGISKLGIPVSLSYKGETVSASIAVESELIQANRPPDVMS